MKSIKQIERVYYISEFLFWFGNALPLALLVLLIQSRGFSLLDVSIFFGTVTFAGLMLEVPTGSLADLIGRKRVTLIAGLLKIVGNALLLCAYSHSLLIAGGLIYGTSRALSSGALDAWFVDEIQKIDRTTPLQPMFGRSESFALTGLALGTLLGSLLPNWLTFLPAEGTAILTPYSATLVGSLLIAALRTLFIAFFVKEDRSLLPQLSWRESLQTVPTFAQEALQLSRQSDIVRLLLVTTFATGFVLIGLENFWQPKFVTLLGATKGNSVVFGIIMTGTFGLAVVGNMLSTPIATYLNNRLGLLVGLTQLLRGGLLLLIVMQTNLFVAGVIFWLIYFGMGISSPAINVMLNAEISAERRSSMLSVRSMMSSGGAFIGSLLLGIIAERGSIDLAWVVCGLLLLLSFPLYMRIDRLYTTKHGKNSSQTPQHETI